MILYKGAGIVCTELEYVMTIKFYVLCWRSRFKSFRIIIENPGFLSRYTGYKNLEYLASIRKLIGREQIRESMEWVGLDPDSRKKVGKYSLGMRQRLGIAQAIMENPDILILDEPMNGLDNQGVNDVRNILLGLKKEGKTVILASHNKEDIEVLCDVVYEMEYGRMHVLSAHKNTMDDIFEK